MPGWALTVLSLLALAVPSWSADVASLKPPSRAEVDRAVNHGLDFLLKSQNKDGSWGSAHKTKDLNIYAPVPGAHDAFRSAVTAMCIEALLDVGADEGSTQAKAALERAELWLLTNLPKVRRAEPMAIYNVWSHAYGIQALAAMFRHSSGNPERQAKIRELISGQIEMLRRYESVDGGWGYLDFRVGSQRPTSYSISCVGATVLVAFYEAKQININIPDDMVKRAVASLLVQQKKDFSYLYGEYLKWSPMMPVNRPAGSLGRSQACNVALRLWGNTNITDTVLTNWLDRLVSRNEWLSFGRKRPIPHESYFQVAGYFFYYGHFYATLCADQLDSSRSRRYKDLLAAIIIPLQEKDGSWWDYPLYDYHQPYGTAFALMSLARCRSPL